MSDCLSRILLPLDRNDFLRHYQTREYFHVVRNTAGYYDDILSTTVLDAFLQSERLPSAFINVVKDGTRCSLEKWSRVDASARGEQSVAIPEKLFDLYAEGATLILNQTDRALPSLNSLCRALTLDLGFRAVANIYITPRCAAGLAKHVDDHEVLVLQIAGCKRWQLHAKDVPAVEIELRPGDLLYLPRGCAHAAWAQEGDSIHITLGLLPVYAFQLVEELAAVAREDGGFEQPQPPRFADDDAKRKFETAFLRQLQDLILKTTPPALLERRFRSLVEDQPRGWPGRLSDLRRFRDMTPETVVCRRPGVLAVVSTEGKFLKVDFAGKRVLVPGFLEGAIGKIMSGNAFAIGEVEGFIGSPGKVKLVAEFVRVGLLRIVSL
jgi:hypothetical protein